MMFSLMSDGCQGVFLDKKDPLESNFKYLYAKGKTGGMMMLLVI